MSEAGVPSPRPAAVVGLDGSSAANTEGAALLDRGAGEPGEVHALVDAARAGSWVVVTEGGEGRVTELVAAGAPPGRVVLEVALDGDAIARIEDLHERGIAVGVVVRTTDPDGRDRVGSTADPSIASSLDEARRGATIGFLTQALLAGVVLVRTAEPVVARRVRAVVGALIEARPDDARMGG
ncbi:MAG: hypothetical protein JWM89_638 [Acidimicrobiales bacterium]|nr:hypothetical protein [Acidimicrobiales bacterium]